MRLTAQLLLSYGALYISHAHHVSLDKCGLLREQKAASRFSHHSSLKHQFLAYRAERLRLLDITSFAFQGMSSLDTAFADSPFVIILGILSVFYIVVTTFYRLYLHPLAAYPGPLLGRLTQWYDVYHAYRGDKHINFVYLHARYGPVVRYSPNSLAINEPAALQAIYGHNANVRKSDFYHGFRAHPAAASTFLATDKAQHARKRRIMGQAFSDRAIKSLEVYVLEIIRGYEEGIEKQLTASKAQGRKWSGKVDIGKKNNYLAFGQLDCSGF